MIHESLPKIWYGGDYNPEQWPEETVEEDIRMFQLAGIDVVTLNVFSWEKIQIDEQTYKAEWLDRLIDRLYASGIYTCLATGTGAHPAWMAKKYPEVLRVDFYGHKRKFGGRHNSCPSSPVYREYAGHMAAFLAGRYQDHPAVLAWHVSNEYGGRCYCDLCEHAFQEWLQNKYGTLDALNHAWNTAFWGHTFYDWKEIVVPNALSEEREGGETDNQGISLDYRRFMSAQLLDCYRTEYEAIKSYTPNLPVTTNLMGTYEGIDYFQWAPYLDVVSWDNYPGMETPPSETAMTHDLMRGLKQGQPFMLMEQTPSQQNWQPYNSLKRPGVMRLWSYQAVAHGADTVQFFQLRRSPGATEKFHGAVIEHAGHEHTRVFRETAALGEELQKLGDVLTDSTSRARAAILYDWETRWAAELSSGPSVEIDYVREVHAYYRAFFDSHIPLDMVHPEQDWSGYDIVVAPMMYMVKNEWAGRVERFTEQGGTFVTTYFSGIADESDRIHSGGYPGPLRNVLGIWVEEIDALPPAYTNTAAVTGPVGKLKGAYECRYLFDLLHVEGADAVAEYEKDFYAGMPVITKNQFGQGEAWYVASHMEQRALQDLVGTIAADKGISPLVRGATEGVEAVERVKNGEQYLFLLNHSKEPAQVKLYGRYTDLLTDNLFAFHCNLEKNDVRILRKEQK